MSLVGIMNEIGIHEVREYILKVAFSCLRRRNGQQPQKCNRPTIRLKKKFKLATS
jgi:hypothetical protein